MSEKKVTIVTHRPGQSLEDKGLSSANLQTALQQKPTTTAQGGNDKKK
ncbi:hypothetical protein NKI19_17820 [Mesorhizobium sp. M0751]